MVVCGNKPQISIVLPVYNGASKLSDALDSISLQTFRNWELLVVNEYGSDDGSVDIIREHAAKDKRIKLIQNTQRLGLADSLNLGIRESAGEYIARMDADDLSMPERFRKQIEFLDANPRVGICGTWQRHFAETGEWVHRPPGKPEQSAANLLFYCDLCHSTIMMRKSVLLENDLYYNGKFAAEDYELWTRALLVTKIANVPEELGHYRYGKNITKNKMTTIGAEHGEICAITIKNTLDLEIPKDQRYLLNAWENIFLMEWNRSKRHEMLVAYAAILRNIWNANRNISFFDEECLLITLRARWIWARWGLLNTNEVVENLEGVFAPVKAPIKKKVQQFFTRHTKPVAKLEKIVKMMRKIWER